MYTVGELLRQWRHRRRLSQLDLAIAADVSARHVSLVETGKSNPSADMMLRLADQLDVPLRERNRLLLAAGFAPRYVERPLDGDALPAAWDAIARVLHAHEPFPALVIDRRWNIVMTDRAIDPFPTRRQGREPPIESEVAIPMISRFGGREIRLFSTTTTFGTPMDITLDEVAIDAESAAYFTKIRRRRSSRHVVTCPDQRGGRWHPGLL
ncbi:helix-turn-helix domain-containing protein [Nonomuraea sp. H19]|uniref:helix-turn-helix domain-containing protein n=1 Tax=Nonomuraea sp. H19 TaxID=3452206 RepID=UPI003F8C8396